MPTIRKIQLENWQSVTERLHASAVDLLPSDMAENPVVRWVVDHDSLYRLREGNQDSSDLDDIERYGMAVVVGRLVASHLQQKLPFYFATLFHIGRVQAVSQYCRENVKRLLATQNFSVSAQNLEVLLAEEPFSPRQKFPDDAEKILRSLSTEALQYTSNQTRMATIWWAMWLEEAGTLRDSTRELDDAWARTKGCRSGRGNMKLIGAAMRTIMLCQSSSRLAQAMKEAGVRVKPGIGGHVAGEFNLFAIPSLFLAFAAMKGDPGDSQDGFRKMEHLMNRWISAEREKRIQPQVDIALDILRSKYGALSPFDEFLPLCRPPSPDLRMLAKEHRLPNSEPSPWLAAWEARLEDRYSGSSYSPLPPPTSLDPNTLEWAVRFADSAIKRNITGEIWPNETWSGFVQRLYERYCVIELGRGAGGANKNAGKKLSPWSVDGFASYIEAITNGINKHGYDLKCPNTARLEVLLTKTTKDEYFYGGQEW